MLRTAWFAFLIAALAVFSAVVGTSLTRSSQPPSDKQTANQANTNESPHETPKNQDKIISWQQLWWRTLNDPVAFFTGVLAIFSGGLLVVACLQIWLLLRAESVSTEAAQAAQSSANAAKQSAETAERSLVQLNRAFIFQKGFTILSHRDEAIKDAEKYWWSINPGWENSGNTPTRDMTTYVNSYFESKPMPPDFHFPHLPIARRYLSLLGQRRVSAGVRLLKQGTS